MRLLWALIAFMVLGPGCVNIPDAASIQDLRILDIRVDPPEITVFQPAPPISTAAELFKLVPSDQKVRFQALVAHPDLDATFTFEWVRCTPGLDRVPCMEPNRKVLVTSTSAAADIAPVPYVFEDAAAAAAMGSGDAASMKLFGALGTFASDPRALLDGLYAFMNLRVTVDRAVVPVDTLALEGTKRLVIFDPQIVRVSVIEGRNLASSGSLMLPGIEGYDLPSLCTRATQGEVDRVFDYLEKRSPNRPPSYQTIEVLGETDTATRALGDGEILILRPREAVRFRGRAAPGDKEEYQLIDDNCELQTLREVLSWSWFTNQGSLTNRLTSESIDDENQTINRHTTTYTAPAATSLTAPETRVKIWSVLRDGRGGSADRVIEIRVEK